MNTETKSRAGLDSFESDLRETLLELAARKRERLAFSDEFAQDLLTIRLLDDLAGDVQHLSPQVFLLHRSIFANARLAAVYRRERLHILDRIGTDYHPNGVNDLVGWTVRQVCDIADRDDGHQIARRPTAPWLERRPGTRRLLVEVCAGFGIVAPILGVIQAKTAYRQWNEMSYAANHLAVSATVERTDVLDPSGKTGTHTAVVRFVATPGSEPCQVTLTAVAGDALPIPGQTLLVVPRDDTCARPLVPSLIGSPGLSLALGLSMMALGLACLRLWVVLTSRNGDRRISSRLKAWRRGATQVS